MHAGCGLSEKALKKVKGIVPVMIDRAINEMREDLNLLMSQDLNDAILSLDTRIKSVETEIFDTTNKAEDSSSDSSDNSDDDIEESDHAKKDTTTMLPNMDTETIPENLQLSVVKNDEVEGGVSVGRIRFLMLRSYQSDVANSDKKTIIHVSSLRY